MKKKFCTQLLIAGMFISSMVSCGGNTSGNTAYSDSNKQCCKK